MGRRPQAESQEIGIGMSLRQATIAVLLLASATAFPHGSAPLFEEPRGFGIESPAGRGGRIVRVTTLDARGPGSLAEALGASGPRIIVFEVAGVIDLVGEPLAIMEPYVTVAGQTAPSPGVTIVRGSISIETHDVLIEHLRVRPGDEAGVWGGGITARGGSAHGIVIDHCSISWARTANTGIAGPDGEGGEGAAADVTIANSIIAEALADTARGGRPHAGGTSIGRLSRNVAIIGNVYAHNPAANPAFGGHTTGVVVHNVIYNPGVEAVALERGGGAGAAGPRPEGVAVVGNILLRGPDTPDALPLLKGTGDVYYEDNLSWGPSGDEAADASAGLTVLGKPPVWPEGLKALPSPRILEPVLRHAGARPMDRDAVDDRIIGTVRQGGGRIIASQDDVGGYPQVERVYRPLEVPEGNIEEWLARLAHELE
jgi:hypothetical protein